jgi:hypothetical protein
MRRSIQMSYAGVEMTPWMHTPVAMLSTLIHWDVTFRVYDPFAVHLLDGCSFAVLGDEDLIGTLAPWFVKGLSSMPRWAAAPASSRGLAAGARDGENGGLESSEVDRHRLILS